MIWYNNRNVVPFLRAIDKQFAFYIESEVDMFKGRISVTGLTLKYLFETLPPKTCFTLFNEKHKDLDRLVKHSLDGGPSVIYHRLHESGVTKILHVDYGCDANDCRSMLLRKYVNGVVRVGVISYRSCHPTPV